MSKPPSLSHLLKSKQWPEASESGKSLEKLQLEFLRIQQGIWHSKKRAILLFEGFDAAGKGGAIHRLTQNLDPRGYRVYPIGPPGHSEQAKHYLYRFWSKIPDPGTISIFDRSWYGRVLVERVRKLIPKHRWHEAYGEILNFERLLQADGIEIIKIFIGISKKEQLRRFDDRLHDPYRQWKLSKADVEDSALWKKYVVATDEMFDRTHTPELPWTLIAGNDKDYARSEVLRTVTHALRSHRHWMESAAEKREIKNLSQALEELK